MHFLTRERAGSRSSNVVVVVVVVIVVVGRGIKNFRKGGTPKKMGVEGYSHKYGCEICWLAQSEEAMNREKI